MLFTRLELRNWRNFGSVSVPLTPQTFVIGPTASGKTNLLDALAFLRDIAHPHGGLARAVTLRGGMANIRSLYAVPAAVVRVVIELDLGSGVRFGYRLDLAEDRHHRPKVRREVVESAGRVVLQRPDAEDRADPDRLESTALEQAASARDFPDLPAALAMTTAWDPSPAFIRESAPEPGNGDDRTGHTLLAQLVEEKRRSQLSFENRWKEVVAELRLAVPGLQDLTIERSGGWTPHLAARFAGWRANASPQDERRLSAGTLRLLALLWETHSKGGTLLLESPEQSLHPATIRRLPTILTGMTRRAGRQAIVATSSPGGLLRCRHRHRFRAGTGTDARRYPRRRRRRLESHPCCAGPRRTFAIAARHRAAAAPLRRCRTSGAGEAGEAT